jgi:hypothetical protein
MHVQPAKGWPYMHACDRAVFEDAAWWVQQRGSRRFTGPELWAALPQVPQVPHSQLDVALEFFKHHGCLLPCSRSNIANSPTFFEDVLGLLEHLAVVLPR